MNNNILSFRSYFQPKGGTVFETPGRYVHRTEEGKLYTCFVDFKKAYHSVWHKGLFHKVDSLGINGTFSDLIKDVYSETL